MKDFIWFVVIGIMFLVIGVMLIRFGLQIWLQQRIELLHQYHYENVSEKDKQIFCKLSGIGLFIIGVGITLSGIIVFFTESIISYIPMLIGLIVGLIMLIRTIYKYNRFNTK